MSISFEYVIEFGHIKHCWNLMMDYVFHMQTTGRFLIFPSIFMT